LDTKARLIGNMQSGSTVYTSVEPEGAGSWRRRRVDRHCANQSCVPRQAQRIRRALHRRLCEAQWALADGDMAVDVPPSLIYERFVCVTACAALASSSPT